MQDDFGSFIIGCSISFESDMLDAGIEIRHISEGRNVPMYNTHVQCVPAGIFNGNMVVSMRPIKPEQIEKAVTVTAQLPKVHGSPIHIGIPELIGIKDINDPDDGGSVTINPCEVPVFWPCGVTPL